VISGEADAAVAKKQAATEQEIKVFCFAQGGIRLSSEKKKESSFLKERSKELLIL
jgi:hypothetical protein